MNTAIGAIGLRFLEAFPAFEARDFRLYFAGQCFSFTGLWIQNIAQMWLIHEITGSKLWVGAVAAMITLPGGLLGIFGGILLDRWNVRKVLYVTSALAFPAPILLAILAFAGKAGPWTILVCAALSGVVSAVDQPGRMELICEIVPDEKKRYSAMSLHSTIVHSTQFVGPSIGGFILKTMHPAWAFVAFALMIVPSLVALLCMRVKVAPKRNSRGNPFRMFGEGVRYATGNKRMLLFLVIYAAFCLLGFSFRPLLPVITREIFNAGPQVLGLLAAAPSAGAVVGTVFLSAARDRSARFFLRMSGFLSGVALVALGTVLAFLPSLAATLSVLFFAGFGFIVGANFSRVTVQNLASPEVRGRINGILATVGFGGIGVGTLGMGAVAQAIGTIPAIFSNAVLVLFFATCLLLPFVERGTAATKSVVNPA